jgi:hypothetical protein
MPALLNQYKRIITEDDTSCPMTAGNVNIMQLRLATDPQAELKTLTASPKEEDGDAEEEEDEEEDDEEILQ